MIEKRFRLRFSDGDNGEVVNQKGVQLSPRQIVDLLNSLYDENEQLKNYFKKRAECSNFQINKLKEEIAELQEDNVDTIVDGYIIHNNGHKILNRIQWYNLEEEDDE